MPAFCTRLRYETCSFESPRQASLKNPAMSLADVLDVLRNSGLVQSVAKLRELYGGPLGGADGTE